MTTLIGRECWHCNGGLMRSGKIIEHRMEPEMLPTVTYLCPDGERFTVHAASIRLRIDAAIEEADDNADYWLRQAEKLRFVRDAAD